MLSVVFHFQLPALSSHPVLRDLLHSFRVSAPSCPLHPPSWDLAKVLRFLLSNAFEPLREAPLRALTKKVLCLLALGGREVARGFVGGGWGGVALTNRFSVLSREETYLIGDSMVGGQTERFANFNKNKRKVKSFPGCRVNKVTEEVEKLEIQSRNSCIIAHVGSNDLYMRGGRVGNSEPIVKDMKRLVNKVSEKTNKGIVVGMLPRSYVSHFALSKAIAINERMKKYCDQKKVEFIDLWGMFVGKRHLFRKDGIHLSEAGQRKFGEILNKECEKVLRSDRIRTRESSEVSPVSRSQGIEENENLEYSFLGFTQEN